MSDFDFDELDKAVAGALSPNTPEEKTSESKVPSAEPVAVTSVPAPKEEVSPAVEEESTPSPAPKPAPTPARPAPAARRNAGRFMDVVHPSSDMRTKSDAAKPANEAKEESKPAEKPVSGFEEPKETTERTDDGQQPLESPFLSDAKVEKRPLGGMPATGTATIEELMNEMPDEPLLEAPDEPLLEAHAQPDPIDFAAHASALPHEKEDTGTDETPVDPAEEAANDEPEAKETDAVVEDHAQDVDDISPVAPEVTQPASISQQYTEQPSSGPESGAIYDTENYHQPLAPAPKKKHGFLIFIWIFLLVVFGAAAGAGFYLYILPML